VSGPQRPSSGLRSWLQEEAVTTRHPSWIAPKRKSSGPPSEPAVPEPMEAEMSEPPRGEPDNSESESAALCLRMSVELASLRDENAALRAQLAEMASAMAKLHRDVLEASEGELVRLALAIAERVVGKELELKPTLIVEWARQAVQLLAAKDEVVIGLARDVAQQIPREAWQAIDAELQTDPLLADGSVEVRAAGGTVAAGAAARLEAVSDALGLGRDE
jgi:flagellar biosynthesis/type III secretory pathway protein FliH